jgi:hypothetical protein
MNVPYSSCSENGSASAAVGTSWWANWAARMRLRMVKWPRLQLWRSFATAPREVQNFVWVGFVRHGTSRPAGIGEAASSTSWQSWRVGQNRQPKGGEEQFCKLSGSTHRCRPGRIFDSVGPQVPPQSFQTFAAAALHLFLPPHAEQLFALHLQAALRAPVSVRT